MLNLYMMIAQALEPIEREKGRFEVKCLVARDPIEPLWDLVLAANWFEANHKVAQDYLTDRIMPCLDYDAMIQFSGIVTYPAHSQNPLVQALSSIQANHRQGLYEYLRADHLVIIQTQLPQARLVIPFDDGGAAAVEQPKWPARSSRELAHQTV